MANRLIYVIDWGQIPFKEAWEKQKKLLDSIVAIKLQNRKQQKQQQPTPNYLILCEHPHTYTLGKSGNPEHLLIDEATLKKENIAFYPIDRGGDITYHGPGQIVAYPILDLENFKTDLHWFLRNIEEAIIQCLAHYGIHGDRIAGLTGVWVRPHSANPEKIAAIGIRCSRWVSMHGLALNVNTDLKYFSYIVPCGIKDKGVTSMAKELGHEVPIEEVKQHLIKSFERVFNAQLCTLQDSLT